MNIVYFKNHLDLISYVSNYILNLNKISHNLNIAISGGKTPFEMFAYWKNNNTIDYSKTKIWQVDERYVSQKSNLSNAGETLRLINNSQFNDIFETINTDLDYQACVTDYNSRLKKLINSRSKIDIVFLGFGTDGHFGSIFPNQKTAFGDNFAVSTTAIHPYPIKKRITVTPDLIRSADKIIVILTGVEKKLVLEELLNGELNQTKFPCKILKDNEKVEILSCFE